MFGCCPACVQYLSYAEPCVGVVDQVGVTMKIMIIDSVDEDDNGDNDDDENVGDGDPALGCQKIGRVS